ncbi:hypothetical protein A3Q56_08590, partial [Intoshia linei]
NYSLTISLLTVLDYDYKIRSYDLRSKNYDHLNGHVFFAKCNIVNIKKLVSITSTSSSKYVAVACDYTPKCDSELNLDLQCFTINIFNSLGQIVKNRKVKFFIKFLSINNTCVTAANESAFYVWTYCNQLNEESLRYSYSNIMYNQRCYHIDDVPSGVSNSNLNFDRMFEPTQDEIKAIEMSENRLAIVSFNFENS